MANSRLLPEDICWGMYRDPSKYGESTAWDRGRCEGTSLCERVKGHVGLCGPKELDDLFYRQQWPSKACHVIPPTRQGV